MLNVLLNRLNADLKVNKDYNCHEFLRATRASFITIY